MDSEKLDSEILAKQYEQLWQAILHYDNIYIQIALLYSAVLGVYITTFGQFTVSPLALSFCLFLISACIIGAIWRLRKLIDQYFEIISHIEEATSMFRREKIKGLGRVRTSTYLIAVIVILTTLALFLTLTR